MTEQEDKKEKKNKIIAIIIAAVLHIVFLLIFITVGLEEPDPPIEEIGLPLRIRLGTTEFGKGNGHPSKNPQVVQNAEVKSNPTKNVAVQNSNPTANVIVAKGDKVTDDVKQIEQEKAEEKRLIDNNLQNLLNKYKTAKDADEGGGDDNKDGDQGREEGIDGGANTGGPSGSKRGNFLLVGRDMLFAAQPPGEIPEEGTVAVEIWVDKKGSVIRAVPGIKGSNTNNGTLFEMAKKAALKTKFSSKPSKTEVQKGVIYYHFKFGF